MDLIPNGNNISFINPLCLEVPYGVVCYSGLLPGAVAVYVCKEDSILRGVISRVCGSSGVWSGQVPLCEQHMLNISTIKPSVSDSPTHTPGVGQCRRPYNTMYTPVIGTRAGRDIIFLCCPIFNPNFLSLCRGWKCKGWI